MRFHRPSWPFRRNIHSPQARGLLGWWPLAAAHGRKALDLAGRNLHGTVQGTASWAASALGGRALALDGSTGYVAPPLLSALNGASALSVVAWVRTDTLSGGGVQGLRYIAAMEDTTASAAATTFILRLNTDTDRYEFFTGGAAYYGAVTADSSAIQGQWQHIAGIYDGATVRIYLDGTERASTAAGAATGTATAFEIGRFDAGGGDERYWLGLLGDLRLYRRALSAREVRAQFDPRTRWELYESLATVAARVPSPPRVPRNHVTLPPFPAWVVNT